MTRCSKIGMLAAVLFIVVNAAGGVYAAVQGELLHAGVHGVLMLLGEYAVWRLWPRRVPSY
jgi:hypothetical protein